jgi:hypothetical protein
MTDQSIIEDALHVAVCQAMALLNQSVGVVSDIEGLQAKNILREALFNYQPPIKAARQSSQSEPVATADYIAYLYSDGNKLKVAEEMPPPDNAFPVFTTNIRFLDVARLVLDDNVDLILEHGGVKLWEALVTKINQDYAEKK